jgi:hypothetical protein
MCEEMELVSSAMMVFFVCTFLNNAFVCPFYITSDWCIELKIVAINSLTSSNSVQ